MFFGKYKIVEIGNLLHSVMLLFDLIHTYKLSSFV